MKIRYYINCKFEYLVEVKNNIELADIAEVLVEQLHKQVDGLHQKKLVVINIYPKNKIQARIPPVNNLKVLVLHSHRKVKNN